MNTIVIMAISLLIVVVIFACIALWRMSQREEAIELLPQDVESLLNKMRNITASKVSELLSRLDRFHGSLEQFEASAKKKQEFVDSLYEMQESFEVLLPQLSQAGSDQLIEVFGDVLVVHMMILRFSSVKAAISFQQMLKDYQLLRHEVGSMAF